MNQVPDIFIDLFVNGYRVGYLRLQAQDCLSVKPKPNWMRLASPYNDTGNMQSGMLLCNVQFLKFNEEEPAMNPERPVLSRETAKDKYRFYYQIWQGFEIAQPIPEDFL